MKKLERLLNLVAAMLATERPLSRHELRDRMPGDAYSANDESFRRAFERDKDELRGMGVPILLQPVPGTDPPVDGYRIRPSDYEADLPELSADELAALHLASNLVRLSEAPVDDPFWKLGGVPSAGTPDTGPVAQVPADDAVRLLMGATVERRVVSFSYGGRQRSVEPHRLVFTRGHWYLTGHDRGREEARQFRVDRFDGAVEAGDRGGFERPSLPVEVNEDPAWRYGTDDPVVARLLVDARHAPWIVDFLGAGAVVGRKPDGSVEVEDMVRNRAAFRSFVLTFLDGAEVLAPPDLRRDVVAWLGALV